MIRTILAGVKVTPTPGWRFLSLISCSVTEQQITAGISVLV